jgi:mannosyltransferase
MLGRKLRIGIAPEPGGSVAATEARSAGWFRPAAPGVRARPAASQANVLLAAVASDRALALGLAAAALAASVFKLPGTSLWSDELFSVQLVGQPWQVFWSFLTTHEANMALYYVFLRGWLFATGLLGVTPDELVVRAPSVLAAVFGVVVVFWIGRRFGGRLVGIVGAILYLLNFVELTKAREARSYALETFLVCLGWYAFAAALAGDRNRGRLWAGYVLAMTLAVYAHLFSTLILASQVLAFAALLAVPNEWRGRVRRSVRPMAVSVAAIGLAILPLTLYVVGHGSTNAWIPPANAVGLLRLLWNVAGHDVIYGALLGAAAITAAVFAARARRRTQESGIHLPRSFAVALGCWLCFPVVLSYAVTQGYLNLHLFAWGYLAVVVPALCLLAAAGVAALPWPRVRLAAVIAIVIVAGFATPVYSSVQAQDFRTASRWISTRYQPGDGLVSTTWSSTLAMEYYARIGAVPSTVLAESPARSDWIGYGEKALDRNAVAAYAAGRSRVFLLSSLQVDDSALMKEQVPLFETVFDGAYVLVDDIVVPSASGPIRIRLYETGSAE